MISSQTAGEITHQFTMQLPAGNRLFWFLLQGKLYHFLWWNSFNFTFYVLHKKKERERGRYQDFYRDCHCSFCCSVFPLRIGFYQKFLAFLQRRVPATSQFTYHMEISKYCGNSWGLQQFHDYHDNHIELLLHSHYFLFPTGKKWI